MTLALVGLGSNLDREASIEKALRLLRAEHEVVAVSPVYESDAEGMPGEPAFWNLTVAIETDRTTAELRASLKRIEEACGRPRRHDPWTSRTLDADLLLHRDHADPDVLRCQWALVPSVDVAPDAIHPATGRTLLDLLPAGAAARLRICDWQPGEA